MRVVFYDDKKKRYTQSIFIISNDINVQKTNDSIMPNFIHSVDSVLARAIYYFYYKDSYNIKCFTIHDEF